MSSVTAIGGGSSKPQGPPPDIQAQLDKYGLQPQGSLQADKAAIAQARLQQNSQKQQANGQQGGPQFGGKPQGPPPDILAQLNALGLQPQGSLQADKAAIASAQSQQQNGQGSRLNIMA